MNGNDVGTGGGPTDPYKTISKALTTSALYIRVAEGTGTDGDVAVLRDNVVIEGGYVRSGSAGERWLKSSTATTNITFSGSENNPGGTNPSIRHIAAFKSDAKSGWTVKDINITTSNTPASTYASDGRGMSNYGFLIINNSSNYTISRVNITLGNAGKGTDGTTPAGVGGAGGRGTGGTGGNGSSGGSTPTSGTAGGVGGNGGGSAGTAGTGTGSSSSTCFACACGCNRQGGGGNGGNGGNAAAAATSWAPGNRPTAQAPANTAYYLPAGQAESGSNGRGGGGGGGGQGARGGRLSCGDCSGNRGGDGGQGGAAGLAGTGGFGGGGVFGIWRYSSSTGVTLTEVNISLGSIGNGGDGAAGQAADNSGRDPGSKGSSGVCALDACTAVPGNGGTGGLASDGGRGRDGANGVSFHMVVNGNGTTPGNPSSTINTPNNITADYYSDRNNVTGRACRNSEITVSTTFGSPNWILPSGLSLVNDQRDPSYGGGSYSSYSTGNSTIKVTSDNASTFYDLQAASGAANTFKNGLYIVPDARTLPSIATAVYEICDGGDVTVSVTNSWEPANIQQREWLVYDNDLSVYTPSSPLFSSSVASPTFSGFPALVGSEKTYIVRYRERHRCCGWSRPVFAQIKIYALPTTPTLTPSTAATTICYGVGASATFTDGTGGAGCIINRQYMLDGDNNWLTYTPGSTVGTTANSSISIRITKSCPGVGSVNSLCGNDFEVLKQWQVFKPDASVNPFTLHDCLYTDGKPYAELSANNPSVGTGVWSVISGGGTISDVNSLTPFITGMTAGGANQVRWSVTATDGVITCTNSVNQTINPVALDLNNVTKQSTGSPQYYTCKNCNIRNGNTYTYYDNVGKIVATIQDLSSPASELSNSEVCVGYNYNANSVTPTSTHVPTVYTSYGDNQPYLPRYWTISPTANTDAMVTLYFTQAEYDALQSKATGTAYEFSDFNALMVTKFDFGGAGTFTSPPVFPATNSSATLIFPTITRYPNLTTGPDYKATFPVNTFSTFYIHPNRFPFSPLPVELLSFTGWNQGSVNKLRWITASEQNTNRFEIQRSANATDWNSIGQMAAAGNSNTQRIYDFTDNLPLFGGNYYRLKIIDNDGSFNYSNVINIFVKEIPADDFAGVYPNPTDGLLNVNIQTTSSYNSYFTVIDILGKEVHAELKALNKGLNTLQFNFATLSKGTYIMRFADVEGKLHTTKFVKD